MDAQIARNNELLERLIGKVSTMESGMEAIREIIREKLNPTRREFVDDEFLESTFGLTKAVRYKLVSEGRLKKYKTNGKASKSLYKYDEVIAAIEKGVVFPKK